MTRSTHTLAEHRLSPAAYDEIASKLRAAGYDHAFGSNGTISVHGLGVTREATYTQSEVDEHIGAAFDEGYEDAVQDLDLATGGDGEFTSAVSVDSTKQRIIERARNVDHLAAEVESLKAEVERLRAQMTTREVRAKLEVGDFEGLSEQAIYEALSGTPFTIVADPAGRKVVQFRGPQ